jgi:multimeric flavodoxin WrbA
MLFASTYWYQSPSVLKLMIDRLVCADGGNPDPSSTHGKKPDEAKQIEERGWHYPKHLAGRVYGVVVHGDVAGVESQRRNLCDWLDWDFAVQDEVRHATRAVLQGVAQLRAGTLKQPDRGQPAVRPK